jgi:hypothetical protein
MLTATGGNKKVGLRPLHGATRFRAKCEYIPGVRQLQGTRVLWTAAAQLPALPKLPTPRRDTPVKPRNFLRLAESLFSPETIF